MLGIIVFHAIVNADKNQNSGMRSLLRNNNNNNNNLFAFPFEIRLQEIYIYFLFYVKMLSNFEIIYSLGRNCLVPK